VVPTLKPIHHFNSNIAKLSIPLIEIGRARKHVVGDRSRLPDSP
jgi:hypothetical protein